MKVPIIQYNHDQPLLPTAKRYSHYRLFLQRDVLALHFGEAKAHYNTLQDFSKILLLEAWLTKIIYNELWGTIYSKGWGETWHSPLWLFTYPHDSSTTLFVLHSTINTWTSTLQDVTYNLHMYPCETKWLEQAMQDITKTQIVVGRTTLWHSHDDQWWKIDAKLGRLWWFICTQWWHAAERELLPRLHPGTLIWLPCPTHLITCASSSWVKLDQKHTDS